MERAEVVPCSVGGGAHLYFPVVAYVGFSQSICLHLFVCNRSLAIFGLPGNHHALRQWHRITSGTIQTLERLAGAWNYPATRRSTVPSHVAAKPDVYRH